MAAPLLASGFLLADGFGLFGTDTTPLLVAAALLLGAAVFAAVHHAEVLALRMGEPFGSILLAVAVTVIEVALIVSILLSDAANSDTVARDTVFSTIMIVLNGVIGLCLVMGGRRHHEQRFQISGAAAALSVLGTLAVFALVMPNFTTATEGPYYVPLQLLVVGVASLGLYVVFVFVQTIRHRDYFQETSRDTSDVTQRPPRQVAAISAVWFWRWWRSCCWQKCCRPRWNARSVRCPCRVRSSALSLQRSFCCRKVWRHCARHWPTVCRPASTLRWDRRWPASG